MKIKKVISRLHPLERKVLPLLKDSQTFQEVADKSNLKDVEIMRALQWLENKNIVNLKETEQKVIYLDENAKKYKKEGLPEKKFLQVIKKEPLTLKKLQKKLSQEEINASIGLLKKKAAIIVEKKDKQPLFKITDQGKEILKKETLEDKFLKKDFPLELNSLKPEEKHALEEFKKRKNFVSIEKEKTKKIKLKKLGKKIIKQGLSDKKVINRLTPKMLKTSSWKDKKFRAYDIKINVPASYPGKKHFVNEAIEYIKRIWLELGFKEMTGSMVQTAFWDLDSLFVPQDHPAREMQDTFYLKGKKGIAQGNLPKKIAKKVKQVHENGGNTGSKGWQYNWDKKTAQELLLRTHTTVLSAQTIAKLKKEDLPQKYFAVSKVFRNETVDWKHLFELTQVEGIVVDENANLKNLKGYLKEFFGKMGFPDIRMRPAHFPYTEPSLEVDVWHPTKKEWVELGGSGIFRPEVTKTLIGKEVPVLAWGLGMERIISEYYQIKDIRDLYKNDLKQLRQMKSWLR